VALDRHPYISLRTRRSWWSWWSWDSGFRDRGIGVATALCAEGAGSWGGRGWVGDEVMALPVEKVDVTLRFEEGPYVAVEG
jgi:hypothetical protein